MTMQKITFSDYIRIQINQTGLKQISCVRATTQTPIPLPKRRIKGSDYREESKLKKTRETETHTIFQIYPSPFIWFGIHPFNFNQTEVGEGYKICLQRWGG